MFEAVPPQMDLLSTEAEVLEFWEQNDVFRRSVAGREGGEDFVFYEGPPTANGRPGLHHVWARAYKDLVCRFWTMRGRRVLRRAGWDTHGLPVEVQVERELGLGGKGEIERYGVQQFVDRCRASVYEFVEEWEALTRRIGYWVDLAGAYWTLDPGYVDSVWWHLRQLWDKGLLFEDYKVVPYCPRCGTALSSHELGQPDVYREVSDLAAFVRFPLEGAAPGAATHLAVWTTTPWTLVSNTAVAVGKDLEYVVVDGTIVGAEAAEALFGPDAAAATARMRGSELVGLRYRRPFDLLEPPEGKDGWRVVEAGFVTEAEGTGLVHIAPAFGADDWALGRRENLPTLNPIGADGRFGAEAGWLAAKAAREVDAEIVGYLESQGLLIRAEPYVHSYPHCWRCSTPLLYWGKPSWYVATAGRKEDLLSANETITWRPEHLKHGRFGEWLANNVDWALSRDRFWGTPLPIWLCEEGHSVCVESMAELSRLVGRDLGGTDPHRPGIDAIRFACPTCGGEASRVEAVIDAWFDSGSMPAAQWGYPYSTHSAESFRFPADFIAEAIDQTRGWFYSLLAVNVLVHGAAPYRTVMGLGHIVDSEGRKMSKSLGNVIDPWSILDSRGADALRWWMFSQGSPWTSTRTSLEAIDLSTSETLVTLWNTWSFFSTYASLNGFDPSDPRIPELSSRSVLDRWLGSRVAGTIEAVSSAMEDYQPLQAATAIGSLIDDLSNWYVRRSRRRFWRTDPDADETDSLAAHAQLHEALVTVSLLLAPFCPFVAERMWRQLTLAAEGDSVHLADWPARIPQRSDPALESEMELARKLVSLGRSARSQAGVKVRQPLRRALVVLPPDAPGLLSEVIAEELNVDEVVSTEAMGDVLSYELLPNFRILGPRLGEAVKEVRGALNSLDQAVAAETLASGGSLSLELSAGKVEVAPEEIEVRVNPKEGFAASRDATVAVALELEVDAELALRGRLRDLVRQLQELRRQSGFAVSDRIRLWMQGVEDLSGSSDLIAREVLAVQVSFSEGNGESHVVELDDRMARVWLEKA